MDRTELARRLADVHAVADSLAEQMREKERQAVVLANGWALEALASALTDRLKQFAADYEVELTDDVVRGVWLASQLVLDLDPDQMLADN
jgi:hypothetical protein